MISPAFAAFVAVALFIHWVLPSRWRNAWLLAASYFFHALIAWQFVGILLLITVTCHLLARRLCQGEPRRRLWLSIGIGVNLGALFGLRTLFPVTLFAEPFAVIGLSFYTLQAISYVADAASGTLRRPGTFTEVALYLAYFPKLLAGPIERAPRFLELLAQRRPVDDEVMARAFTLIAVGITRKLVIADPLRAMLPDAAFSSPEQLGSIALATALVGFVIALYNDFAGYTAVVRGISLLFGIELSPNFARPFFAIDFASFWNRWHITLSHWLRDYIYLPLSRALLRRRPSLWNVPNLILPPMVTMLASGLWHGPSMHMLMWGGVHGVFLFSERLIVLWRPRVPSQRTGVVSQIVRAILVFFLGTLAFAFFRMDVGVALVYMKQLLVAPWGPSPDLRFYAFVFGSFWLDGMQARHGDETTFFHWPRLARATLLAIAFILWFMMTRGQTPAPFIYRGF